MTRKTVLFLVFAALSLSGCKKPTLLGSKKAKVEAPVAVAAQGADASAGADAAAPAAPPPPDVVGSAAPAAAPSLSPTTAPAAPATTPKPQVDQTASVMVLCYHNIEDNSRMKALTISVAEFEKELQTIKDNGFSVIPMQDFLAWRRGEKNIPHKSCVITIDDGWLSGYTNAWPLLKKYGYPFTMFIYVNYVGTGGKSLSWDQLAEMRDAGVDIQSHTYSHSNLRAPGSGVDKKTAEMVRKDLAALGHDGWLRKEIVESKKTLEEKLGIKVNAFAYPFGNYTAQAREMVKEAGYEAAFTVYGQRLTHSSPYDLLGRYAVETAKPIIFQNAIAMIGGGVSAAEASSGPSVAQLAASSMITEPADGAKINTPTPTIKANLATMGDVDASSLDVRISGVGQVPHKFDPNSKLLTAPVTQKLKPGEYTVIVSGKVNGQRAETKWTFKYDPSSKPSSPADAPLPPRNAPAR